AARRGDARGAAAAGGAGPGARAPGAAGRGGTRGRAGRGVARVKLRWADPVLARVAALLVRLLAATWRYREHGREHLDALRGRPYVYALWHSRILPLLFLHRAEHIVLLISRHRDGEYLAD